MLAKDRHGQLRGSPPYVEPDRGMQALDLFPVEAVGGKLLAQERALRALPMNPA